MTEIMGNEERYCQQREVWREGKYGDVAGGKRRREIRGGKWKKMVSYIYLKTAQEVSKR